LENLVEWFKQLPDKVWTWLQNVISKVTTWAANMMTKGRQAASQFIQSVVDYIQQLPEKIATWLQGAIEKVTAWGSEMVTKGKQAAADFVDNAVDTIKGLPEKISTWLQSVISKVSSWGSDLASKGRQAAQDLVDSILDKVEELPSAVAGVGEDLVRGIWNGISDMGGWIENKIAGFVGDVAEWLKEYFGIESPSKLMRDEVGKWIPAGIAVGIDENAKSVLSSVKDLTANTVGAAKSGLSAGSARTVSATSTGAGGVVNNFYQTINSPKQLNRLDIYRNSKNLLGYAGGVR
jgi:phage-related protein